MWYSISGGKSAINGGMADVPTPPSRLDSGAALHRRVPWPVVKGTFKVMVVLFVIYFFVLPQIPGTRAAVENLRDINPALLVLGFALEIAALVSYSKLTHAALPRRVISLARLFRIQLSTKAVSSIVPAGSAAGNALGYRLLTLSGVQGTDAGFALATVGLGSAVVLNLLFLVALLISIPIRGVNPFYGLAAIVGVALIGLAAALIVGLLRGQARAEHIVRSIASRLKFGPDKAVEIIRHVASRVRELLHDRRLLTKVISWAVANWLLDAAALWVFLRSLGGTTPLDGLLVAFCLANLLAVIPVLPGGLGIIEGVLIPTLVGFRITRNTATLGVIIYRLAQYWIPMLAGGVSYLSLTVGPWSIDRRDSLMRLRDVASDATKDDTNGIDWAQEYGRRPMSSSVAGDPLGPSADS